MTEGPAARPLLSGQRRLEASKEYAVAVQRYSQLTQEDSLYHGPHYRQLGRFLTSTSSRPASDTVSANRYTESSTSSPFTFVTIHTFKVDSGSKTLTSFDASDVLKFAQQAPLPAEIDYGQLIFLRGYPSAEWLNLLGKNYEIDPEFFRRHMCFTPYSFLDLPALPTSSRNIIQLRFTAIFKLDEPLGIGEIRQYRKDEMKWIRKQHQDYLRFGETVGRSIIRREFPLNQTLISVEQTVSCYIEKKDDGWIAIIWLDHGRPLAENPSFLWNDQNNTKNPFHKPRGCTYMPMIFEHFPKIALALGKPHNDTATPETARPNNSLVQPMDLLHSQYGQTLDSNLIGKDPFYALSEMLNFASSSENQFLNAVQQQISEESLQFGDQMEFSLYNLQYYKEQLDSHAEYIAEILNFLRDRKTSTTATTYASTDGTVDRQGMPIDGVISSLICDFRNLHSRAQALSARCTQASNTIVSAASLEESRKAILKAEIIERLTILAFFFLPFSCTTSFFGMNFQQFGTGTLSIWIGFVAIFTTMFLAAILCFPGWFRDKLRWINAVLPVKDNNFQRDNLFPNFGP